MESSVKVSSGYLQRWSLGVLLGLAVSLSAMPGQASAKSNAVEKTATGKKKAIKKSVSKKEKTKKALKISAKDKKKETSAKTASKSRPDKARQAAKKSVSKVAKATTQHQFVWTPANEPKQAYYVMPATLGSAAGDVQPAQWVAQEIVAQPVQRVIPQPAVQPVQRVASQPAMPQQPVPQVAQPAVTPPVQQVAWQMPQPEIQRQVDVVDAVDVEPYQVGTASYYGKAFEGKRTASGERFSQENFTCAHGSLPFGCRLRVTNLRNKKSVEVKVNDRGGFSKHGRVIDLSKAAAKEIGMLASGTAKVQIDVLE